MGLRLQRRQRISRHRMLRPLCAFVGLEQQRDGQTVQWPQQGCHLCRPERRVILVLPLHTSCNQLIYPIRQVPGAPSFSFHVSTFSLSQPPPLTPLCFPFTLKEKHSFIAPHGPSFEMVVPLSRLPQHTSVVCGLYRTLLRNTIHLGKLDLENHVKLIHKIRKRFRTNASATNSLVVQKLMEGAVQLNDVIVKSYGDKTDLQPLLSWISPISPPVSSQPATTSSVAPKKSRKNPDYAMLSEEEIEEFRNTKELPLPQSTKSLIPSIHVHARWYFNTRKYPPLKSRLDKRYMRTVFPSLIAHEKQMYYINRLLRKLERRPSHKLRRISGTGHWIYVINTPWNRDLRTENFKFLGEVRKKYDELVIELQESDTFRKQYEHIAIEEAKWECLLDKKPPTKKSIDDWTWVHKEAQEVLNAEKYQLESEVIKFCKRQALIYEKIKPIFDKMQIHSKTNSEIMEEEIEVLQMGPYTDVLDGGLGMLLKKYGFRDPIETKYPKKPKRGKHMPCNL